MRTSEEIKVTIEEISELLQNSHNSGTNQLRSTCPYCGKKDHFYLNKTNFFWDCKKCKESGNAKKLLIHFGVLDQYIHKTLKLDSLTLIKDFEPEVELVNVCDLPNKKLPRGYQRIYSHPYLESRGLVINDFHKYNIGVSKISTKLKDYIIMLIEEDGGCKGYVSRCILPKNEIEENDLLRYRNSSGTKFNSLLFGYDEITRGTKTVIVVEGVFDKIRLDNILMTVQSPEIKVVCTFGNKISDIQIEKLKITSIVDVVLFYDLDAIQEMKRNAPKLKKAFGLKIACLLNGKDPGDAPEEEVIDALFDASDPNLFFYDKCNGRKIKL